MGRDDLKDALSFEILTARQMPLFLIQGQRRVGKTSLLNFLPRLLGPRFKIVPLDLQGHRKRLPKSARLRESGFHLTIQIFWTQFCAPAERATVKQILAGKPPTDPVSRYRLELHGYIVKDGDGWKMRVPLFEQWLKKCVETFAL